MTFHSKSFEINTLFLANQKIEHWNFLVWRQAQLESPHLKLFEHISYQNCTVINYKTEETTVLMQ